MSLLEHYKTQIGESIELADSYACSQCRETLPTEQFLIERDGGHITKMPYCQRCFGIIQSTGQKRCKDCGDVKLLSKDFGAHVSSMDGHYHSCTDCMQTANRQRKAAKQQTQSRTYDSVEHRNLQYQHRSGYIPEEEFRRQNDLFRQYGYYWKDYV